MLRRPVTRVRTNAHSSIIHRSTIKLGKDHDFDCSTSPAGMVLLVLICCPQRNPPKPEQ